MKRAKTLIPVNLYAMKSKFRHHDPHHYYPRIHRYVNFDGLQ